MLRGSSRRGLAAVEFVMVLPLVLFLLLGLLWAGGVAWRSGDVAVKARQEAWRRKAAAVHGPFDFADQSGGHVTATKESPVVVAAAVDGPFVPRSTHHDRGGGWHHPAVDMDRTPNWKLQALALRGTAANVVNEIAAVLSSASALPGLLPGAIKDAIASQIAAEFPMLGSLLGALQQAKNDADAEKERVKAAETARLGQELAAAQKQLTEAKERLTRLEADIRDAETRLAKAADGERQQLEDRLRTLRRQADESRLQQAPLAESLRFLEEQRRLIEAM